MRRIRGAVFLLTLAGGWSAMSFSSEFQESDVLPVIGYVAFTRDAVGFVSRPNGNLGKSVFWFSYERQQRRLAEVDAKEFQARFPGFVLREDPRSLQPGDEWIGHAGKGTEYQTKIKYCGEGIEDDQRSLIVGGKAVRVLARNKCTSVSAVEIVGDQLWLGTAYSGEGGYSEAEGIIVESRRGERELARIPLKGWVAQLRADPFSDDLWAVTEYGIYRVGRDFKIASTNLYYHDFDPSTGEPRLLFSSTATAGNPLSVVSRMLPAEEHKAFYEAVFSIPKVDLLDFNLYDFFMCCSFSGHRYGEGLRPLLPFFVRASARDRSVLWRQAACGFGTPDVSEYCSQKR
jgi:hypothetical protein